MSSFPVTIHSAEQVRALDRYAIQTLGVPGYTLMCRAGEAAFGVLRQRWPKARRVVVICGPGNNGGDGYVMARLALAQGVDVRVIATSDPSQLRGDASQAFKDYRSEGGLLTAWSTRAIEDAEVIVDAIFGIGLSREVDSDVGVIIDTINESGLPILALDIPSGLHADSGAALGTAVRADCTLTFIGLKLGFYVGQGPNFVGALLFDPLALSGDTFSQVPPVALRIDERRMAASLPPRVRTAHKGMNGDVLIIGGGIGMAGAARLAGEAALRCGAGRVTIATHPDNVAAIVSGRPELMCRGVRTSEELEPLLQRADVLAAGPGLGQDKWALELWKAACASSLPSVFDADALNLLAQLRSPMANAKRILTPHPGEASRLLGVSSSAVQADRVAAARALADRYGSIVVLKGACSIVMSPGSLPHICDRGNPGMASPGMGDVLTGVIAGLLGQLGNADIAAQVGVWVHASAGDRAASRRGERGLIASDLFEYLGACVNPTFRP